MEKRYRKNKQKKIIISIKRRKKILKKYEEKKNRKSKYEGKLQKLFQN